MSKKRTTKPRRRPRPQVLEVRVMSPRIAWFGFLRFLGGMFKFACLLALATGIGWGVWQGVQKAFYENPDFRLQVIQLNPNPVIDANGLAQVANIDIDGSLFDIDIDDVIASLKALPGVADVKAERHLPGTLVVNITPRVPRAWLSCAGDGLDGNRKAGGMLVDQRGVAYPCPELQLPEALHLPVIELPAVPGKPIRPGQRVTQPELAQSFALLKSACDADPEAAHWIESIRQVNKWSMLLVTRDGISATFSLGDHERQISRLRAAMDHASQKSYAISTINLIPKHNVPITLRGEAPPPRATQVTEPTAADLRDERRKNDLNQLLNRN